MTRINFRAMGLDDLELGAKAPGRVTFEVDGSPASSDGAGAYLTFDGRNKKTFKLEVKQKQPMSWSVSATLAADDKYGVRFVGDHPPEIVVPPLPGARGAQNFVFDVHVSPVRNVTKELGDRCKPSGAAAWMGSLPASYNFVDELSTDPMTFSAGAAMDIKPSDRTNADAEMFLFQIAGIDRPQLAAVYWPTSVTPSTSATSFLIYYRPTMSTAGSDPYPLNSLQMGVSSITNPGEDPLSRPDDKDPAAFPYQAKAAGKDVVLVLPVPSAGSAYLHGFDDQRGDENWLNLLRHIQLFMVRARGKSAVTVTKPKLVAMAGWSFGCSRLLNFVESVQSTPFGQDILKQLYFFDPSFIDKGGKKLYAVQRIEKLATSWASVARNIRLYGQPATIHRGTARVSGGKLFVGDHPKLPNLRIISTPPKAWLAIANISSATKAAITKSRYWMTHDLICDTMLRDAMRFIP